MAYFDLGALKLSLGQAIYGGAPLSQEVLSQLVESLELEFPIRVLVTQGMSDWRKAKGICVLSIHPGIDYCFFACGVLMALQGELTDRGVLFGPAREVKKPEDIVLAIRASIGGLRQKELGLLQGDFDGEKESQLREKAIRALRKGESISALEEWTITVFRTRQVSLFSVRRELVSFLVDYCKACQVTCHPVDQLFGRLVGSLYEIYALSRLRESFLRGIEELQALLRLYAKGDKVRPLTELTLREILTGYTDPISLVDLAAKLKVSSAHLARIFRKDTGSTVVEMLQNLRIQHARDLLERSTAPISQIASASGFESMEHFHRLFKQKCARTPLKHRQLFLAGSGRP